MNTLTKCLLTLLEWSAVIGIGYIAGNIPLVVVIYIGYILWSYSKS